MAQPLSAPPVTCTHAELASIVANASFLWERLDLEPFTGENEQAHDPEIDRRLHHWCQVVAQGNWDTLQKRLQWEGLDLDTVRPLLGTMRLPGTQPLPAWAETLRQIMQTAKEYTPASASLLPTDPDHPIPFEDVLLSAIAVARQQLLTRLGSLQSTESTLPLSMLSYKRRMSLHLF